MPSFCEHYDPEPAVGPATPVCAECSEIGGTWVHLRQCLTCGEVGCCDLSPNRHATAHFHATGHPMVRSIEPGEAWQWCYADDRLYEPRAADLADTGPAG